MTGMQHWLDVAASDDAVLVRVFGLGDMRLASLLNDLADHCMLEKPRDILIGFMECTGLDSTFMGTLLRISELMAVRHRTLRLYNVTPVCLKCLQTLGVDCLLRIEGTMVPPDIHMERMIPDATSHARQLQIIHHAHTRLASANAENRERFGVFLQALEREMAMHPEDMLELDDMADAEDVDTAEIEP